MEILPQILFYSLLTTFVLTMLLSLLHEEVCNVLYVVYDTITHSIASITDQARR